jgi:hypothetical protein
MLNNFKERPDFYDNSSNRVAKRKDIESRRLARFSYHSLAGGSPG